MSTRPIDPSERATTKPVHLPTVLAVGCSERLISRCWSALASMGVMVRDCEPSRVALLVATRQPLAIIVTNEVRERDPEEFDALARDVSAVLVTISEEATAQEIEVMLNMAIRTTMRRREEQAEPERCALLPGGLELDEEELYGALR